MIFDTIILLKSIANSRILDCLQISNNEASLRTKGKKSRFTARIQFDSNSPRQTNQRHPFESRLITRPGLCPSNPKKEEERKVFIRGQASISIKCLEFAVFHYNSYPQLSLSLSLSFNQTRRRRDEICSRPLQMGQLIIPLACRTMFSFENASDGIRPLRSCTSLPRYAFLRFRTRKLRSTSNSFY